MHDITWSKVGDTVLDFIINAGINIIIAAVVLFIGIRLSKFFVKRIANGKGFKKLDQSLQSFFLSFIKISLNVIVILTAAYVLGVPMISVITVLASAGLAIGMAMQGSLTNFAGGIMLLIFKPFKVGDKVEVQGQVGFVQKINVFYTYINTLDGRKVMLPNGAVSNNIVINHYGNDMRRVDIVFTVDYDSDIELVKKVLLEAANEHPLVSHDPKPVFCRLTAHNDSSLQFELRAWAPAVEYENVRCDLMESVTKAFEKNNISIPYPHMDVHIN